MPDKKAMEDAITEAMASGAMRHYETRNQIKLSPDSPKIVIAMPIGDKDDPNLFYCTHCERRHFGQVRCEFCGEQEPALRRLRHAGLVPAEIAASYLGMVPPLLCSIQIMFRKSLPSAIAREQMTYLAMKQAGVKYIFYWDDDVILPPKALYDLHYAMELNPDVAILSGVYCTREQCAEPLIYKNHGEGSYWNFTARAGVIEPIFAAGAGCMIARIEALREVQAALGDEPLWHDEHDMGAINRREGKIIWGHDIRFCRRMWLTSEQFGKNPAVTRRWQVALAGWVQCYHLDIESQTMYGLPANAPCFKDSNRASYWDYVWNSEGFDTWRTYPALYDRIVDLVPERSRVVDFGCGIGVLMDRLAKQKQAQTYGYDLSPAAIEKVKSRWLEGEVCDAIDFKMNHFPGKSTVVVSTETINHLDDDRLKHFLSEAKKAKLALFSAPEGHLEGTPVGEHLREFDGQGLKTLLRQYYSNVKIERIPREEGSDQHLLLAVCSHGGKKK